MTNPSPITAEQINAGLKKVQAIAEAIRELGAVPSGHLYAQVMGHLSESEYQKIIGILKGAGLVVETNAHMLVWKEAA